MLAAILIIAVFASVSASCAKTGDTDGLINNPADETANVTDEGLTEKPAVEPADVAAEVLTNNPTNEMTGGQGEQSEGQKKMPTDEDIIELYNKAKEAYGWFDMTTIPHSAESYVEVDGVVYYEVVKPGITSMESLVRYLNELFADEVTEGLIASSSGRYVERDGKLYVLQADRGTDIFKGGESCEVTRLSDYEIKLTVKVEVFDDPELKNVTGYETYDFFLENSGNRWRFKNFESVR